MLEEFNEYSNTAATPYVYKGKESHMDFNDYIDLIENIGIKKVKNYEKLYRMEEEF